MTVLFCDLSGSTSLGERLDSESLRRMLGIYFSTMEAIIERHGGTVEKFIGDAIMAVFGLPTVREDDALRAARSAIEMQTALSDLNDDLEPRWGVRLCVRTGVNTGEVVAGDPARGHGFVTGDAVNVAARLEQAARGDEILIGESTHRLVRGAVRVEEVEPLTLKGKAHPVRAFRLLEVDLPLDEPQRWLDAPLVGRERELSLLRKAFDRCVAQRKCALVLVQGAAGVGKSRLTTEFLARLAAEASTGRGRCLPYGEGITFWPLAEVLKRAAGITGDEAQEAALDKIARLLPEDEDAPTIVQRLADVLGWGKEASHPVEIFWAVRRLLEALAADRPLVLVFDDVQWGEPTFLELLEHLAISSRTVPILIVVLARPELLEVRPGLADVAATEIAVGPLSGAESRVLIEKLLAEAEVPAAVAERVSAVAEGNPLFVEELLRMLVEEGHLKREGERWSAVGELSVMAATPTIQALIAARLDRLSPAERAVVERASVVGKLFWPSAVRELSPPEERPDVDGHLEALGRKQLLLPDGTRFAGEEALAFSHMLVREVAYQGMLKEARADLHTRCAAWLEQAAGERATEYEEIIGYHLEQAFRYLSELHVADEPTRQLAVRAVARLESGGARALARGDMPAAVNLLERASSLLPHEHPERQDIALKLGIALAGTGQLTRVKSLLTERVEAERGNRCSLVYHNPAGRQQIVDLDDSARCVSIGRRLENDVSLSWDTQVSRRHAELHRTGTGWVVVDDGTSRNGSYLNGERFVGRRPLSDGDVLRFGDTIILFRAPVRGPHDEPAPVELDGATAFGDRSMAPFPLSDTERRVLAGLRGDAGEAPAESAPVSDAEIARRVSLSEDEVRAAIEALKLKLGIEGASEDRRRERVVVRAATAGLLSEQHGSGDANLDVQGQAGGPAVDVDVADRGRSPFERDERRERGYRRR